MITIIQEDLSDIDNRPVDSSASGDDKENMTTVVRNILLVMLYSVHCTLEYIVQFSNPERQLGTIPLNHPFSNI